MYVSVANFGIVVITETFLDDSIHDSHITPPGYMHLVRTEIRMMEVSCFLFEIFILLLLLEALHSTVRSAFTHNQTVILCGNFNLPHID